VGRLIIDTSGYLAGTAAKHPLSEAIRDILRTAAEPPVVSPLVLAEIDYMVLDGITDALNAVLADRYDTNEILTTDQRHFRVVVPPSRKFDSFRLLPADR